MKSKIYFFKDKSKVKLLAEKLYLGGKLLTKYDLYPLLMCFNTNVTFVTLGMIPNVIDMKGT